MTDDPTPDGARRGLSKEAWGAITAVAVALITGAVTLATHVWSPSRAPAPTPAAAPATVAAPTPMPAPAAPSVEALAGRWQGNATGAGGVAFRVEVEIVPGCRAGVRCGEIMVASVPCRGALYLQATQGDDFEFRVQDFIAPSGRECQPGAGEHFQLQPDGTLVYVTSYEPRVRAVLTRRTG